MNTIITIFLRVSLLIVALVSIPFVSISYARDSPLFVNPTPGKVAGKTFRHPTGITFWYPGSWRMQPLTGIVQLVPSGACTTNSNYESYFVTAEDLAMDGITRINDPAVIQYLDQMMQSLGTELGVYFMRSGGVTDISNAQGSDGIRLEWSAQSQVGAVKGRAWASIVNNWGMVIAGVGIGDALDRRDATIQKIFASFSVGEGKHDMQLVGSWTLKSVFSMQNNSVWESDYSRAQMVSEDHSSIRFSADGNWVREDRSQMLAGAGGIWLESNNSSQSRGRWNAENGALFMLWDDGSFEDYKYTVRAGQLRMVAGSKGQFWTRE